MRLIIRRTTTFKFAALGLLLLAVFVAFFVYVNRPVTADDGRGRLITIHDRGQEKVILSEAATIKEALADAEIEIDQHDVVEPELDEQLVAKEYSVNIYRARPVTIIDGFKRYKVVTAYQTAEQIIDHSDIDLYPEDKTTLERSDDIIGDGAGLRLIIDRATEVSLSLHGSRSVVRTQAESVRDLLKEKGIILGEKDRVSPEGASAISEGLSVRVWREGIHTVSAKEDVKYATEYVYDADRDLGYKSVKKAGENGVKTVTYQVEIREGKEVSRKRIAELVTKRPVAQIEIIGSKVAQVFGSKADIMRAAGIKESDFGYVTDILNRENALWCATRWQGQNHCPGGFAESYPGREASNQVGYGLCQATPANKMASAGPDWRINPVTQMKWCNSYAIGRYGSWQKAQQFSSCIGSCYSPYSKSYVIKATRWW